MASGVSDIVDGAFVILSPGGQPYLFGPDDPDVGSKWHMLADATPEPAKPSQLNCAKCGRSTDVCQFACTDRGACELTDCPCLAKSPPAQEAPKAAPVCENPHGDNGSDIDTVVVDGRAHRWCVPCWSAYVVWTAEQTGAPYAGPERLPRPQLAADWVEDCLPTVWR